MARSAHGEGVAPRKWRGQWRASLHVGYDAGGKQKRKYVYGATEKACLKKWNDLKRRRDEGLLATGPTMTVADWFEQWLDGKKREISPRTIEGYGYTLRHILPRIGKKKLEKLTPIHVRQMQLSIADEISERTAVGARGLVHNALDDALKLDLIPRNVAAAVAPIRYEKTEFDIWTAEEVIRFLKHVVGSRYYGFFYTALTTGMRPGELIALHWEDIGTDTIHVRRGVSVVANVYHLGNTKTKRGNRVIPVSPDTLEALQQHREVLLLDAIDSPLVFPSSNGTFLQHGNIIRSLRTWAKRAEVKEIRTHDLRHTYASMAIANNMNVVRLSRQLGHSNASFTLDVYAHLFERHQGEAAPSLHDLLGL